MVKVITFLKRKDGMPVEEFQSYWRTRHPKVVTRLPGVRRYVQSHTQLSAYRVGEPAYDGIAEVWADDTAALRAMTQSPHHAAVQEDEARFIDRASMGVIITEDHVLKDGTAAPDTAVKNVTFVVRKEGLAVEDFQRHWLEVQGPLVAAIPTLRRYVQSHTRRSAYESGRVPAYDGASITCYDSAKTFHAATTSAEYLRAAADGPSFLAMDRVRSILTKEHVIVP
jgi:uncharacterized protein (TIGR02118 family)